MWTPGLLEQTAYLYSPTPFSSTVFWLSWAIFFPHGSHALFLFKIFLNLFPRCVGVLLMHHKLIHTEQLKMTPIYHLMISVGQKSRLSAQVLVSLKSKCQMAAFSSDLTGLLPSSFRWLSELSSLLAMHSGCHTQLQEATLLSLSHGQLHLQSQPWRTSHTSNTSRALNLSDFDLFLHEEHCPFEGLMWWGQAHWG